MSSNQSSSRGGERGSTSTPSTKATTNTSKTKSTGPYDRNFLQNLIDHRVYPDEYEYPDGRVPPKPDNWAEIHEKLVQPRPSLSPSEFSDGDFRNFKRADAHAPKEKLVSESVIPIIEGKTGNARCISGGIPFTNLNHLTDGTLVAGNPDRYYGAPPEQLDRRVRNELAGDIIPSTQHDLPIAPNFFLAAKGPDGSLAVAGRQACYDGALGARGMHSLQSYGQDEALYDNRAHTIATVYHGGTLKMYTSHPSQPTSPGGRPEYYTTQLRSFAMTDTVETFRQGATAYRNARDWAKEQRNEAIRGANERVNGNLAELATVDTSFSLASETSLNESYTIESVSQASHVSLTEDTHGTANLQESETSTDELPLSNRLPTKRSSRRSRRSYRSQRKRPNADESSGAGRSH
jgi:hypothetical protein